MMYKPKLEKDIRCPLEYGLGIFGGKWKSRIICVLAAAGTLRYGELRKEMTLFNPNTKAPKITIAPSNTCNICAML